MCYAEIGVETIRVWHRSNTVPPSHAMWYELLQCGGREMQDDRLSLMAKVGLRGEVMVRRIQDGPRKWVVGECDARKAVVSLVLSRVVDAVKCALPRRV